MSTSSEKYIKNIVLAQKDGEYFLEKISRLVTWRENCAVLDVGCGPGNVTHDFLLPILPKSATLTAIDNAVDVIRHAKEHYCKSSRVEFIHMDILSPDLRFAQTFDYIVSLYCLHFVADHRTALMNICSMLKEGGEFFFTCAVKCDLFSIIAAISVMEKWRPYIYNSKDLVSPYQFSENPKEDLKKLLTEVGFDVHFITSEPRELFYPFHSVKDVFFSVHSIVVPNDLETDFQKDLEEVIRSLGFSKRKSGEEFYCTNYQTMFGRATKTC